MLFRGYVFFFTFGFSSLIVTFQYVLMDNFCPCLTLPVSQNLLLNQNPKLRQFYYYIQQSKQNFHLFNIKWFLVSFLKITFASEFYLPYPNFINLWFHWLHYLMWCYEGKTTRKLIVHQQYLVSTFKPFFFYYKISFVNLQHAQTNSFG